MLGNKENSKQLKAIAGLCWYESLQLKRQVAKLCNMGANLLPQAKFFPENLPYAVICPVYKEKKFFVFILVSTLIFLIHVLEFSLQIFEDLKRSFF